MTSSSGGFALRGADGDETRILAHDRGYAIAIPGRPMLGVPAGPAEGTPRYDAVVTMQDAPIELGVRLDDVATTIAPDALVTSLAVAYAASRAHAPEAVAVRSLAGKQIPDGATVGVGANYALRGDDPTAMEFLAITGRPSPPTVLAMHLTVRYHKTTPFAWANLRTALLAHHAWTGELPSQPIWPSACAFLTPSVRFELTDAASREARAKAEQVGAVAPDEVERLAETLIDMARDEHPPSMPWHPLLSRMAASRVAGCVPSRVAEVLLRNLDEVTSMHDFRGWCWQCYWAVGNRTELGSEPS